MKTISIWVKDYRWRLHGHLLIWAMRVIPKDLKEAEMLKLYLDSYFTKMDEWYAE